MAKVILPALSGEASGKLGDVVFLKRFGEQIARLRTKPANPNTMLQQITRGNLKALAQAWKGSGDAVMTRADNTKYVVLKKYDTTQMAWVDVEFNILTDTEKQAWQNYAMQLKGYKQFGRLLFIGNNIKLLKAGQNPVRTP